jgi:putative transcriptional regulator
MKNYNNEVNKMTEFDCRLKVIFAERKIKVGEFAKKVGISQASMSAIINDRTLPRFDSAYRIAEALDMRIEEIWRKD